MYLSSFAPILVSWILLPFDFVLFTFFLFPTSLPISPILTIFIPFSSKTSKPASSFLPSFSSFFFRFTPQKYSSVLLLMFQLSFLSPVILHSLHIVPPPSSHPSAFLLIPPSLCSEFSASPYGDCWDAACSTLQKPGRVHTTSVYFYLPCVCLCDVSCSGPHPHLCVCVWLKDQHSLLLSSLPLPNLPLPTHDAQHNNTHSRSPCVEVYGLLL